MREAVRRLQIEGLVEHGPGSGSFVTDRLIEEPPGAIFGLFRSVEEQGLAPRSIVRRLGWRQRLPRPPLGGWPTDRTGCADPDQVRVTCGQVRVAYDDRCWRLIMVAAAVGISGR